MREPRWDYQVLVRRFNELPSPVCARCRYTADTTRSWNVIIHLRTSDRAHLLWMDTEARKRITTSRQPFQMAAMAIARTFCGIRLGYYWRDSN